MTAWSKGVVEHLRGYAQRDLGVPLLTEAHLAGRVLSVHEANAAAVAWCADVNAALHSETCAVPDERLAQDAALFAALPSLQLPNPAGRPRPRRTARRSSR